VDILDETIDLRFQTGRDIMGDQHKFLQVMLEYARQELNIDYPQAPYGRYDFTFREEKEQVVVTAFDDEFKCKCGGNGAEETYEIPKNPYVGLSTDSVKYMLREVFDTFSNNKKCRCGLFASDK
jgi:hypothetical protein